MFDFKKEFKELYAPKQTPQILIVPPANFVCVMRFKIPYFTTMSAALAAAKSLKSVQDGSALEVKSLQEYLGGK